MTQAANSALHSARLRFVEGLPARAEELSTTAERLSREPGDQEAAAMLRRRLHALLASAQVFEERALALAVQDLIARLDIAQRSERAFTREEIDAVGLVVASLPTYVRPSLQPPAAYSDVRELRSAVATLPPAAVSGDTWRPPARERSQPVSAEPMVATPVEAPVLRQEREDDPGDFLPPTLGYSTPPAANDLADAGEIPIAQPEQGYASGAQSGQLADSNGIAGLGLDAADDAAVVDAAAIAFELAGGKVSFGDARPLPARARRIIALAELQPGPGGFARGESDEAAELASASSPSEEPREVALEPVRTEVADTDPSASAFAAASMRPLPTARESSVDLAAAAAALFAGEPSALQVSVAVDPISEILRSAPRVADGEVSGVSIDSWSQAVAEASDELAAWRDSLHPSPIPEIAIVDDAAENAEEAPSVDPESERAASADLGPLVGDLAEAAIADPPFAEPLFAEPVWEADSAATRTALDTLARDAAEVENDYEPDTEPRMIIDLETVASPEAREGASGISHAPPWLEPNRVEATGPASVAAEPVPESVIERNSLAAGSDSRDLSEPIESLQRNSLAAGSDPVDSLETLDSLDDDESENTHVWFAREDIDTSERASSQPTLRPGFTAAPVDPSDAPAETSDRITLDMRSPGLAEWAEIRKEQARATSSEADAHDRVTVAGGLEPVSRILPIAAQLFSRVVDSASERVEVGARGTIAGEATDADADSSATTGLTVDSGDLADSAAGISAIASDADADADSSATATLAPRSFFTPVVDSDSGADQLDLPLSAAAVAEAGNDIVEPDFSDETSPGFGPPVLLKQTVSGLLPKPGPARLLLVADSACVSRIRGNLPAEAFTVFEAESADDAIRQLREHKPELVLVSADLASSPEVDLVRRLKTDPLAAIQRIHVLLPEGATFDEAYLEQIGADGALAEPLTPDSLEPLVRETAAQATEQSPAREGSIDDIAAQIAEEIRRGIAESLRTGKTEQMRVGDGSQLMAAAWSAIGRVRSHLADQSRGQARNEEGDGAQPSLLPPASGGDATRAPSVHPSQLLAGCRVLVADDDPAVLWFFVGLLREASAHVLQAHNGREALELARRKLPHVIVSDILMPKLDGFGLCRELKRDALLSHVPVILLSWKDDLLQRMRELDAGAAGYLRKEAGSQQILAQLTDVLQPRMRLLAKLRGHADVSGSLADLGALSLLELVAAERPDALVAVRDAWNMFEVEIRAGRRLSVTRTAADGAFTRGEKALMQLIGLAGGEFQVSSSAAPLKAPIPEPLDRAIAAAGRKLSAVLDAVSDARLLRVCLVAFDDDVLQSLLAAPSTRMHEVVALFRTGNATAEGVLREGRFAPGELEDYLRELARCAAITGVWDASGEDLVAAAQRERETPQLALLSSTLPPRSGSGWSVAPETPPAWRSSIPPSVIASSTVEFTKIDSDAAPAPSEVAEQDSEPAQAAHAETVQRTPADSDTVPEAAPPSAAAAKIQTQPGIGPESLPPEMPDWLKSAPPAARPTTSTKSTSSTTSTGLGVAQKTSTLSSPLTPPPSAHTFEEHETDAVSKAELESFDLPIPSTFARALPERSDRLRLAGTLIVLAGVGYFGWQQFVLQSAPTTADRSTRVEAAKSPPNILVPAPVQPAPETQAQPQPAQPTIQNTQFGKVLPFVDTSRGVAVGPDQGLLVVELSGSDPAPNIRIGTRELGKPPLAVALSAGRHELVVRSGKSTSFRYLIVRAGETRIVSVPLAEL